MTPLELEVRLENHDQHIKSMQHQIDELREVQGEIKVMSETLVTLTAEIKHTNAHLARHERQLEEIEHQPRMRLNQIITAIIAALAGALLSAGIPALLSRIQ